MRACVRACVRHCIPDPPSDGHWIFFFRKTKKGPSVDPRRSHASLGLALAAPILSTHDCNTHSQPKSLQSARRGLAENPKRPCEVERPARLAQDEDRVSRLVTKTCGKAVRFERASGEAGTGSSIGSKGSHGPAPGTSESKKSEVVMAARQSATTSAQARQSSLACNAGRWGGFEACAYRHEVF